MAYRQILYDSSYLLLVSARSRAWRDALHRAQHFVEILAGGRRHIGGSEIRRGGNNRLCDALPRTVIIQTKYQLLDLLMNRQKVDKRRWQTFLFHSCAANR